MADNVFAAVAIVGLLSVYHLSGAAQQVAAADRAIENLFERSAVFAAFLPG